MCVLLDGRRVVSGALDSILRVWYISSEHLQELRGHGGVSFAFLMTMEIKVSVLLFFLGHY
jgi:hypothetical protein